MSKTEIKAELLILGYDERHDDITKLMGVAPTQVIAKGEIKKTDPKGQGSPLLEKQNVWLLALSGTSNDDIEGYLEVVIDELEGYQEQIKALSLTYEVELSIYGFAEDVRLAAHLSPGIIARLAQFGVALDIDIYPS